MSSTNEQRAKENHRLANQRYLEAERVKEKHLCSFYQGQIAGIGQRLQNLDRYIVEDIQPNENGTNEEKIIERRMWAAGFYDGYDNAFDYIADRPSSYIAS